MKVITTRDTQSRRGPAERFTGEVWMDASPAEPPVCGAFHVFFAPGARTNWHTHPEGQILHIVSGEGRVAMDGGPAAKVRAGDVVYFAPGERHWHGASPGTYMVHLAINPASSTDGGTDWMEPVTDEEYGGVSG